MRGTVELSASLANTVGERKEARSLYKRALTEKGGRRLARWFHEGSLDGRVLNRLEPYAIERCKIPLFVVDDFLSASDAA